MAISKARKDELVAQYVDLLDKSGAVFFADYTGMTVKQLEELRAKVRETDGAFHITKNTLLQVALTKAGHSVPDDVLQGQVATGFALGEAPSMAKVLTDYAKSVDEMSIRGGLMDAKPLTDADVKALADLPSMDELRATILSMVNAPARNLVGVVAGSVRQVVNVIDAYASKEEGAPAEAEA